VNADQNCHAITIVARRGEAWSMMQPEAAGDKA
jgi:hypothetical protein